MQVVLVLLVFCGVCAAPVAFAQKSNTSSPYSRYGIGEMKGIAPAQNKAMAGLSTGVRYIGMYDHINPGNPASYSAIQLTTIDAGLYGNISQLSNRNLSENSYNFSLTHFHFAFPMGNPGTVTFGVEPYSEVGYNYMVPGTLDTMTVHSVYAGEGGTTKAFLGYGVRLSPQFSVGLNAGYLFGTINQVRSIEYPFEVGSLNGREDRDNFMRGFVFDYGVQYFKPLNDQVSLVIGAGGSAAAPIQSSTNLLAIRTPFSVSDGTGTLPVDTISFIEGDNQTIDLPQSYKLGFSVSHSNRWMVGADFNYGQWSNFRSGGINGGLEDSYGVAVGGQITPDPTSVRYLNLVDYRLGFKYNKTAIEIVNEQVDQLAVTFGFGFPLPSLFGTSFYKVNFSAELGQMGKISNSLVRERYANLSLGFTLNDRWFRRASYD